jgi:TonB-linked SusC/RagA family outer membrane protein
MKRFMSILVCFMFIGLSVIAQDIQITGTITNAEDGNALPGVSVGVKGTTNGTATDVNGKYTIKAPTNGVLIFSFVGMQSQEVEIGGKTVIDLALETEALAVGEVVVTALGISKEKKALGYSVQDVKSEEINRTMNTNLVNSISGKVAGVQVTSSAGVAGGSSFITIRGRNSITGDNQPLFVVDGVPIDNSMNYSGNPDDGTNNLTNGVAYSNRAIDLNPDDVESVSVLKGGAASALYGLRAANGAIIITTKKGKNTGGLRNSVVNFNSSVSFDEVNKLPGLQTSYTQGEGGQWIGADDVNPYKMFSWGARIDTMRFDGSNYKYDANGKLVGMSDPTATSNHAVAYDNPGNFFRTGVTYNNNISVSGGNDVGTLYVSYANTKSTGVVPNNDFTKNNFKISGEAKASNKLTISGEANYINSGGTRIQQGSNISGVMLGLMRTPPTFDDAAGYQFDDGTQRNYRGGGGYDNPYWTVNKNQFKDQVNRLIGNVGFSYKFNSWANLNYKLGTDFYTDDRKQFFDIHSRAYPAGQVFQDHQFNRDLNSDLLLILKHNITNDLDFNLTLGNNMFQSQYQQLYAQGDQMTIPGFYHISNTSSVLVRESDSKKRTAAFFGDLTLSYKGMLFYNGTYRKEWSTTLPDGKNAFPYWSSSLGFVFTELSGLKDNSILSFGKLRASYAIVANDAPVFYTATNYDAGFYNNGYISGISFPFEGTSGFQVGDVLGNSELKPEKLRSAEVGGEFRFLKNRIGIDVAYYNNRNSDLILQVPVSGAAGYIVKNMNAAVMENKGIEMVVNFSSIKTSSFEWETVINFTKNNNKVTDLAPGVANISLGGFTGTDIRAVKGYSYGSIFGSDFIRDSQGRIVIDDVPTIGADPNPNYGYPVYEPSANQVSLGSTLPDWTMGFTNSFRFKGIELSMLIDVKKGGKMWDGTRGVMNYFGTGAETGDRDKNYVFDGVLGHTNGTDPATGDFIVVSNGTPNTINVKRDENWYTGNGGGFDGPASQYVEDASWVRLKELSLSYALRSKLVDKTKILKGLSIFVSGRNLWLLTPYKGIDPETNLYGSANTQGLDYFNMPSTKTYTIGLKAIF